MDTNKSKNLNESVNRTNNDEIDLMELFRLIKRTIKSMLMRALIMVSRFRLITIRYRIFFLSMVLTGIVVGLIYWRIDKKYYDASLILQSNYLDPKTMELMISGLNDLCDSNDTLGIAELLKVDLKRASSIKSIRVHPFLGTKEGIEVEMLKEKIGASNIEKNAVSEISKRLYDYGLHTFRITAKLYNPEYAPELEAGLLKFLGDNEFVKKRIEINQIILNQREEKLTEDLKALDSLKNLVNKNFSKFNQLTREGSNNVILEDKMHLNPIDIYQKQIDIFNEIQSVKSQLYLKADFEIVSKMVANKKPGNVRLAISLIAFSSVFLVMAYLVILMLTFNRYLQSLALVKIHK